MKIGKNKSVFVVIFALAALILATIAVHGCGVSSYSGKKVTSISIGSVNNAAAMENITLAAQTVQQLKATGHYPDSTTTDLSSSIAWSSSNQSVATVSATGLVTAVAPGTCTITATAEGVSESIQLTVNNLTLQTITISPASPAPASKGFTQQFTATGLFSDGTFTQDITTLVTWSSSKTSVATISNTDPTKGLATAVSAGTSDITAQWNGKTSPAVTFTVSNLALQSISITAPSFPAKHPALMETFQLTATGTFVDNTSADITSQVAWSSENPDIATVDSAGMVTGVSLGRATIDATLDGITQTIKVTIFSAGGH